MFSPPDDEVLTHSTSLAEAGKTVRGKPDRRVVARPDSGAHPTPWARTVASGKTEGNVRLRYAPRDPGVGSCESSTET